MTQMHHGHHDSTPWHDHAQQDVRAKEAKCLSSHSQRTLPYKMRTQVASKGARESSAQGGMLWNSVVMWEGPTMSTPQQYRSGVKHRPASVAYPGSRGQHCQLERYNSCPISLG